MTTRKNQSEHDGMIMSLVAHLKESKFTSIRADLPDHTQPVKITWKSSGDGHIPDASAVFDGTDYLFEVETDDSIGIDHTRSQWELFSANAKQYGKKFIVVVPKASEGKASAEILKQGYSAEVWTVG